MSKSLPKLVILDRDGVINYDSPDYIKSPEEWLPIESSLRAIKLLNDAGIKVGVASNQRGVGRGLYDEHALMLIAEKMHRLCQNIGAYIDAVRYCPALERTHPDHKPNPGMLLSLLNEFSVEAEETFFVGDKLTDVQAAINANCMPVMVETGYGFNEKTAALEIAPHLLVYPDLLAFVEALLRGN